jgi:zinc transport system substrate-binding protein
MSVRLAGGALILALLGAGATACGEPDRAADGVQVVTGFYPLQYVTEQVGGAGVTVSNLVQPGAEPHDLELSPRQVADISDADLVVYLSGFQPQVDEAVAQEAKDRAVDAASVVATLPGAAEEGGHDPHLWLDPNRLAAVADAVAARLATVDPAGAAGYRERATDLRNRLVALDGEYAAGLVTCQRRDLIVSHAAFGYLADRYHLNQIGISGLSPEAEPTPQRLAEVADTARTRGATTIFFETLVSPKVADAIAREVGAASAVLDPIEGLEPGADGDYFSVMRENLAVLRTALGCQ